MNFVTWYVILLEAAMGNGDSVVIKIWTQSATILRLAVMLK